MDWGGGGRWWCDDGFVGAEASGGDARFEVVVDGWMDGKRERREEKERFVALILCVGVIEYEFGAKGCHVFCEL